MGQMSSYEKAAERAAEKPAALPGQLDEPVVWLSAAQASTVAAHPGLAALGLALPCWAPQRLVGRALGHGPGGVDAAVARDARIAVKEIVNGCLCCTKVGDLADALRALYELRPNRILVEASGSALPGQLVWEIEKLEDIVRVDGVVSVVDCANFLRINNFSRTAKIQAKCIDLVLLNKVELAGEDKVDEVLDDLGTRSRAAVPQAFADSPFPLPVARGPVLGPRVVATPMRSDARSADVDRVVLGREL